MSTENISPVRATKSKATLIHEQPIESRGKTKNVKQTLLSKEHNFGQTTTRQLQLPKTDPSKIACIVSKMKVLYSKTFHGQHPKQPTT